MGDRPIDPEQQYLRALKKRCMATSGGCREPRYRERLCRAHWDELMAKLDRYARPECLHRGCERPAAAGASFCTRHAGETAPERPVAPPAAPATTGTECLECDSPAVIKGRCMRHYKAEYRRTHQGPPCNHDGCTRHATSRGMCNSHYQTWRRKSPDTPRCSKPDCDRAMYAKGLCAAHYEAARTGGDRTA